jgi:hypothetical protein
MQPRFGGESEGKRPLGRPRRRREDKLKLDLRQTGWDGMGQWRALVNTIMNLRISGVAEPLLASQAGLSSIELLSSFVPRVLFNLLIVSLLLSVSSYVLSLFLPPYA